jgi:hypothetical protein
MYTNGSSFRVWQVLIFSVEIRYSPAATIVLTACTWPNSVTFRTVVFV